MIDIVVVFEVFDVVVPGHGVVQVVPRSKSKRKYYSLIPVVQQVDASIHFVPQVLEDIQLAEVQLM